MDEVTPYEDDMPLLRHCAGCRKEQPMNLFFYRDKMYSKMATYCKECRDLGVTQDMEYRMVPSITCTHGRKGDCKTCRYEASQHRPPSAGIAKGRKFLCV